ncbi:hypothetical protein HMPREF3156_02367 [Neisseria sp. HMSC06F02]|nr:hypothetical protein HMPREF3156_02367 [Neisseria sp. HMSC06F02]
MPKPKFSDDPLTEQPKYRIQESRFNIIQTKRSSETFQTTPSDQGNP